MDHCLPPLQCSVVLCIVASASLIFLMTPESWHEAMWSATSLLHLQIDGELVTNWASTAIVQLPLLQTLSIELEYN